MLAIAVPGRFRATLLVVMAAVLGALAHGPPAFGVGGSDPWQAAAARVSYPLYRPTETLGFTLARVQFDPCGDSANSLVDGLYTKGSGKRQAVFAFTEEYPRPCGDPGESSKVTTVDVNGASVDVNVFCYSPGPRCTAADGFTNGYLLFLRPAGPTGTRVVVTSRRVTLDDLLKVVRSLAKVPRTAPAPPVTPASASCSMAEARRVVDRLRLGNSGDPTVSNPVAHVLCGAFFGPGSQAMVASLSIPSCGRTAGWVVFRRTGATWKLVMERNNGADLDAVGTAIRETQFVLRPGDAHCFPTGGTRSRTWRWNGARFTSSPWRRSKPAAPNAPVAGASTYGFFKTPSGNIVCGYSYDESRANVGCVVMSGLKPEPPPRRPGCAPALTVALRATERAFTTDGECPGEDAPETPYVGAGIAKVLAYGTTWSGGGIRCTSASTGLTCRNKDGHGFFLSRERWRQF